MPSRKPVPLVKRPPGRPKGSKNRKTLLKEYEMGACIERFGMTMAIEMQAVVDAVVEKAKGGDIAAAKLLFDRVIPLGRDQGPAGGSRDIVINIGGLDNAQVREAHKGTAVRAVEISADGPKRIGQEEQSVGESGGTEGDSGSSAGEVIDDVTYERLHS